MFPAALLLSPPGRLLTPGPLRCHGPSQQPSTAATRGLLRVAGSPVVRRVPGDGGGWPLWHQSGARVALSTSPDGLRWGAPVSPDPLLPSADWWTFDTAAVRPSDVLLISNPAASSRRFLSSAVYWLYYTGSTDERFGSGSPFPAANVPALPGLAISQDSRHWARIEGDPHSGALFGVSEEEESQSGRRAPWPRPRW